ncbi:MAG TPA: phosphoribosylanthranilate isomerase [Candidatus Anoxymicrobiaceae bacterium]|jgi:phosphoribosylanthranilate isomerase
MWIKICGITRLEDAISAARFGADAVGFVFADSPRRVRPEVARRISREMPRGPSRVGVFVDSPPDLVRGIVEYCELDLVQLHGAEDAGYCETLGELAIKAVRVKDRSDILRVRDYSCPALLLDGYYTSVTGGRSRDWTMLKVVKPHGHLIIAGGLDPGNVAGAIKDLHPYGVDVSSGVESAPGVKDPVLMYKFIESARKADYEVNDN